MIHSEKMLRVLYFAPRICVPANTGSHLRNYHLCKELAKSAEVTFLTFANQETEADSAEIIRNWGLHKVEIVPYQPAYTVGKLLQGLISKTPLPVLNYTHKTMADRLARLLEENDFDIVEMESVQLANYLPLIQAARSRPLIIGGWHNVESELMFRYGKHTTNPAKKFYANLTAKRLGETERRILAELDAHIAVSERDRQQLMALNPQARTFVIDNGVDTAFYSQAIDGAARHGLHTAERNRLLFVGSMDYHANIDAVSYFANEVWNSLYQRNPAMRFTIVGRHPAAEVRALAALPGVEVTGTVAHVRPFYQEAFASVVPLRVGSGSRLKILESMAAGVPVISTTLGAEGLEVREGENIFLADEQEAIARRVLQLYFDTYLRREMAIAGQELVRRRYDWSAIGSRLFDIYQAVTRRAEAVQEKAQGAW